MAEGVCSRCWSLSADIDAGRTININTAKKVVNILYAEGGDPVQIVQAKGLAQVSVGVSRRPSR